ncbi:unnamed protein product [Dibothriocephalus latus]|uniref:Uncharacterized protein n=1 Tax=Dibothriocephalus latus TaxID=60516 RepID=A0A3P7NXF6_DIBLA|nr:unnamed protein product [Dibothriocephalus latus]
MAATPITRDLPQVILESRELCWQNSHSSWLSYMRSVHQMPGFSAPSDYAVTDGHLQKSPLTIMPEERNPTVAVNDLFGTWRPLDLTADSAASSGDCYPQYFPYRLPFANAGLSSAPGTAPCRYNSSCHVLEGGLVAETKSQAWTTPWCGLETSNYTSQGQMPREIEHHAQLLESSGCSEPDAWACPGQVLPMDASVSLSSGTFKHGFLFFVKRG